MLRQYLEKINTRIADRKTDLFIALLIFLVSVASFGLGRLSAIWPKKEPISIEQFSAVGGVASEEQYVASKNGSAYHYPWCSGASRIKEANKIWFDNKDDAERAGYKPAGNCPGL